MRIRGPDSVDVLDALLGQSDEGRAEIVLEGIQAKDCFAAGGLGVYSAPPGSACEYECEY